MSVSAMSAVRLGLIGLTLDGGSILRVNPRATAEASAALVCPACAVPYSTTHNVPVELVPCGHTICARCLGTHTLKLEATKAATLRCPVISHGKRCAVLSSTFSTNEALLELLKPLEEELNGFASRSNEHAGNER